MKFGHSGNQTNPNAVLNLKDDAHDDMIMLKLVLGVLHGTPSPWRQLPNPSAVDFFRLMRFEPLTTPPPAQGAPFPLVYFC